MEDVLRIGGQYDGDKYSRAAMVTTNASQLYSFLSNRTERHELTGACFDSSTRTTAPPSGRHWNSAWTASFSLSRPTSADSSKFYLFISSVLHHSCVTLVSFCRRYVSVLPWCRLMMMSGYCLETVDDRSTYLPCLFFWKPSAVINSNVTDSPPGGADQSSSHLQTYMMWVCQLVPLCHSGLQWMWNNNFLFLNL